MHSYKEWQDSKRKCEPSIQESEELTITKFTTLPHRHREEVGEGTSAITQAWTGEGLPVLASQESTRFQRMLLNMNNKYTPDYVEFIMCAPNSLEPEDRWLMRHKWEIQNAFLNWRFRHDETVFVIKEQREARKDFTQIFAEIYASQPRLFPQP